RRRADRRRDRRRPHDHGFAASPRHRADHLWHLHHWRDRPGLGFRLQVRQPPPVPLVFRLGARLTTPRLAGGGRTFARLGGRPPTLALDPPYHTVKDNDFITILGPSGCGKSPLLRIVAGLDQPSVANVLLDGMPVVTAGPDRGMVFQSYTLFPWLSVRENI